MWPRSPHGLQRDGVDFVTGVNCAFGQDLGAQASAMAQALDKLLAGQALEMFAGLAEANTTDADVADCELAADQMIEGDAAGDDVAAGVAGSEVDAVVAVEGFEGFSLDESEFEVGLGLEECALLEGIAVAIESDAGNRLDGADGVGGTGGFGSDVNGFDDSVGHGVIRS